MDTARQIRAAVAAIVRPYRAFPYPGELRTRVVGFAHRRRQEGASWRTIGDEVGVDPSSVYDWCAAISAARTRRADVGLVPVVMEAEPVAAEPCAVGPTGSALSLVTPGGYRLQGLGLDDALVLLGRLP